MVERPLSAPCRVGHPGLVVTDLPVQNVKESSPPFACLPSIRVEKRQIGGHDTPRGEFAQDDLPAQRRPFQHIEHAERLGPAGGNGKGRHCAAGGTAQLRLAAACGKIEVRYRFQLAGKDSLGRDVQRGVAADKIRASGVVTQAGNGVDTAFEAFVKIGSSGSQAFQGR